ncbi:S-adenosyl-L-methionine-dependent methyltransferase [Chaetoceros tenuissimus]|uniref:S-adenosyl-L-methionine-dependent methyltransferase n=1 Tax=Chaetoceros tenuissimus TaxID=426638 RepID=A0AAD3H883_9STRA|nr:S-adenosyl-L-methionine-dependent methyltransferase [Chaetoceros tenuissimus]
MGWSDTWNDIISGGNPRWKVTNTDAHEKALAIFKQYVGGDPKDTSIFVPLAGDDPMVKILFDNGYSLTTIDLVPAAVEEMKKQFGSEADWTKEEKDNTIIWSHESGRVKLMIGDVLQRRPELENNFDAVYDKDSFGALQKDMRKGYCTRISEYVKSGGTVYLECKLRDNHEESKHMGPPFSLLAEDIMDETSYGNSFEHVKALGAVYDISMPMQQTGHILRRK